MDAVKFLREHSRMCTKYDTCEGCPLEFKWCEVMKVREPEKIVAVVENGHRSIRWRHGRAGS